MVMEASRTEYLAKYSSKQQLDRRDNSSTPGAEPSSSGASTYTLLMTLILVGNGK